MPPKAHSSDWDRLFNPRAPRRRGPIALFIVVTLSLAFVGVVIAGGGFGAQRYDEYVAAQKLTSTPLWGKYYADQTATAQTREAAAQATPTSGPTTQVVVGGNLRSEPRIAPETVVGQVVAGDTVALLEQRDVDGQPWHRVRLLSTGGAMAVNVEGWVSGTLLAPQ
jgi:hypothetical protein